MILKLFAGLTLCVLFFLCLPSTVNAQDVKEQKRELQRLRNSITATQNQLKKLERSERSTKSSLRSQQKHRHQIAVFVEQLQVQLLELQDSARRVEQNLVSTRNTLKSIEQSYNSVAAQIIEYRSKHRGVPSSKILRDLVFKKLSAALTTYRREMNSLSDSLQATQSLLQDYALTQEIVIEAKRKENQNLAANIAKQSAALDKIKTNKSSLQKQLTEKKQSLSKMRSIIADLVARERKRELERRKEQEKRNKSNSPRGGVAGNSSESDEAAPHSPIPAHSLPWPTQGRRLLQSYGQYKSEESGMTLDNPGIDIKQSVGSSVRSVASGTVSSVTWLPGYGSVVILDHKNGMRTVYANLASVGVQNGASVQQGALLGTSGENIDGDLLHFEVWIGKLKQNPTTYLR
ncbi:MAG: peptidoglycan DD-metalloendopeptidase family protein [Ignavibacteria bacterium]|nr:peptidoglycan DD-metalloendopeptidase family protein [Ignavibacteria bacterium]